jgi:ComF family protein
MSEALRFWNNFSKGALDWIYPSKCALCGTLGELAVCRDCENEMEPRAEALHAYADEPLAYRASIYPYTGRASQAVRRLKYERATALAEVLSQAIYDKAIEMGIADGRLVVPVPIHWTRLCSRGFNQADLLCERFHPEAVDSRVLRRVKATRQQVGLTRAERQRNLQGAFKVTRRLRGERILLIDDVLTTGQTAVECAKVLHSAGALEVGILAFAGDD